MYAFYLNFDYNGFPCVGESIACPVVYINSRNKEYSNCILLNLVTEWVVFHFLFDIAAHFNSFCFYIYSVSG